MSGAILPYALLAALATALLVAAFTDLRRREINNELNAAIALVAPLWWWAMGFSWAEIGFQIALMAGTLVLTCVLFATNQMGGGDVKLLTALALWFTPASFFQLVVLMAVLGGGASIAMAAFNMKREPGESLRDGLAGVAALAWVWCACALVFALATHRPLLSDGAIDTIATLVPSLWLLALIAAVVLAVLAFGIRHIVRRQKSRLPVPYGIAIAAAGLWVLGEQTLLAARAAGQTG